MPGLVMGYYIYRLCLDSLFSQIIYIKQLTHVNNEMKGLLSLLALWQRLLIDRQVRDVSSLRMMLKKSSVLKEGNFKLLCLPPGRLNKARN